MSSVQERSLLPASQSLQQALAGWLCLVACASQTDAGLACLQDFLKEVDLQFLDHMRRGTSINFADLASDPPPATMQAGPSLNSYSIILIVPASVIRLSRLVSRGF